MRAGERKIKIQMRRAGARPTCCGLLQFGVFGLGLFQDWHIGVGIFPGRKEVLVGRLGFGFIALQRIGPSRSQPGQRIELAGRINAAMIQNLLIFGRCFRAIPQTQISVTTNDEGQ